MLCFENDAFMLCFENDAIYTSCFTRSLLDALQLGYDNLRIDICPDT